MNPSVEDAADESNHGREPHNTNANESSMSWSEIFARHETMLATHLELLHSVKAHVAPQGEASRSVSTMVNKTVQAISQNKLLRRQMLSKQASDNASTSTPHCAPTSNMNSAHQTHTPQSTDAERSSSNTNNNNNKQSKRRKRSRTEKEKESDTIIDEPSPNPQEQQQQQPQEYDTFGADPRASKRKREALSFPGADEDVRSIIPVSLETEDISAEVQRRLQIMEERRRKKESEQQPEKRKRESVASNESFSSSGGGGGSSSSRPKKRRARLGMATADVLKRSAGGDGALDVDLEANERAQKQRKTSR